jgi:hypothetical protein
MSQRELAAAVGISNGSVLGAPFASGLTKVDSFGAARDRRRQAYILAPKGIAKKAAASTRFLGQKLAEYEAPRREIEAPQGEVVDVHGHFSGVRLQTNPHPGKCWSVD